MFLLEWLQAAVAWVLVAFVKLWSPIFGEANGVTWVLSIVGLVIIIRILLIPLFVKQIKAQRNMQLIQPRIKELKEKHAGDREKQSAEMMKIYRETGTNPLASCLPILLQAPIFFALFRVLQGIAANPAEGIGPLSDSLAQVAHDASIFGVPIYGTFAHADETPFPLSTQILAAILIITMSSTTFLTQRQLIVKNTAKDNPMVKQQKILMYVFPVIFAVGGFNFPIGVLIYWTTTNIWSMGQQFYVIRNNPQPDTPAARALESRKKEKAQRKAIKNGEIPELLPGATDEAGSSSKGATTQNRQQPKRQPKSKRQPKPGTGSKASSNGSQSGSKPKKSSSGGKKTGNQGKSGKKPSK